MQIKKQDHKGNAFGIWIACFCTHMVGLLLSTYIFNLKVKSVTQVTTNIFSIFLSYRRFYHLFKGIAKAYIWVVSMKNEPFKTNLETIYSFRQFLPGFKTFTQSRSN